MKPSQTQTPPPSRITSPAELMKLVAGFRPSRIILTAFELDVFSTLGARTMTSARAAAALGVNVRGLDRLMNALCALGLLEKKAGRFSNTPFSAAHLVKGKPGYLGGLAHTANMWQSWSTMTRAVSHGGTVIRRPSGAAGRRDRTRGFIAAMHWRATAQAAATLKLLDLSTVRRTLDVGGGSGAYSLALVRAKKDIQATVFDLPDVISLARAYVKEAGLSKRFTFLPGDFNKDAFGQGYDLVLLSAIIHMNSAVANRALIRKCAQALNSGGRLVVQDFIMNDDRTSPAAGALFALNMLVGTRAGDTYTEKEVGGWMRLAGLSGVRRIDTPFESSLIIGRK
jgi:SAM-dependent methyltransferase